MFEYLETTNYIHKEYLNTFTKNLSAKIILPTLQNYDFF